MGDSGPMSGGDDETAQVMTSLGARLRAIRQARGLTLAQLAAATGISVSTLSRLESGQREPGLRHLLPLARAHRLPLDELVGSRTGDPRVHPRPFTRHGQTWVPLTRNPNDGLHAYKQILPAPATPRTEWTPRPEQGSHEGHEWLYVLSGRLLLALGEHDLVLTAGETAEFDTRVPHGIANAGDQPVEWIALYGAQGERMHIRVRPTAG
ncbi:transcriptional regulator, XRE family with cupin sensor [Streptomyces sp. 2114.2]|uniref:Transcriptional regulator n=6 Tax=Streptomyces TaxID=1883 RepID=A0ABN4DSK9_STRLI|nr:transcriptional regulator [Streptomyces lividans TK24]PSK56407.1 HTH-type transcriptional regulator PuuR [Streptomyces sp. 111WW2]QSJ09440.1 transcriptional regulator [Streptomyces lividans]REH22985.1 XRE family transcriptional regulator [Streptomyces sp. 2221.1]SDT72072.1 transcriptional regulator, XRE family with cupin sensor [Streptomyces sp. 2114.2]GHA58605.1 XRE family transcriptional regulator [Streptomyces anthocyanicus]